MAEAYKWLSTGAAIGVAYTVGQMLLGSYRGVSETYAAGALVGGAVGGMFMAGLVYLIWRFATRGRRQ